MSELNGQSRRFTSHRKDSKTAWNGATALISRHSFVAAHCKTASFYTDLRMHWTPTGFTTDSIENEDEIKKEE